MKCNLLIGVTGSIACKRLPEIINLFTQTKHFNIKVILTSTATLFLKQFIDLNTFETNFKIKLYYDCDDLYNIKKEIPIHIELRKWANTLLLVPLTANTLAKISNGICDNLLTMVVRSWEKNKKCFFCLAMNNLMYEKDITHEQINTLIKQNGFVHIQSKLCKLSCGDIGIGGIADSKDIVAIVCKEFGLTNYISKY